MQPDTRSGQKGNLPPLSTPSEYIFQILGKNGYKNVFSILLAGILDRREKSFKIQTSGGLVVVVVGSKLKRGSVPNKPK